MRKTIEVVIPSDDEKNRDKGKIYVVTEWPARRAGKWGTRALIAVARAGATLAPGAPGGMGGLVAIGGIGSMLMYIDSDEVTTLLDELLDCVKFKPAADKAFVRDLIDDDIEEIATLFQLKQEVFALHTGFTLAELKSKLTSAITEKVSWIIQMLKEKSESSSPPAKPPLSS